MKSKFTVLLSVAALAVAPVVGRAQLAPYSREELAAFFTFASLQSDRGEAPPSLNGPLKTASAEAEGRETGRFDLGRLTFLEAVARMETSVLASLRVPVRSGAAMTEEKIEQLAQRPTDFPGLPVASFGLADRSR